MMEWAEIARLLDRGSASDALRALEQGDLTSVKLLEAQLERMDQFDGPINAVVARDVDRAQSEARTADQVRADGGTTGPLHGLPMTVKDTYETEGLVTVAGARELDNYVPTRDADLVVALRQAGAIVLGKTNTPLYAGDHQTYNDVYGRSNNPHDLTRTPGGSSGGAAAAVAGGFTLAEVGSDIGGSIRLPAHFNGVFGLKPTHGVLSLRGHIPGPAGTLSHPDLAVAGPLARSVEDLVMLLEVLVTVGSFSHIPGATLPGAVRRPVAQLRIGVWSDDEVAPVARGVRQVVGSLADRLAELGAMVSESARPETSSEELHGVYMHLLMAQIGAGFPPSAYAKLDAFSRNGAGSVQAGIDRSVEAAGWATSSHRGWLSANERRAKAMASWDRLFESVDLVMAPVAPTVAFPHNTELSYNQRVTRVDAVDRPYTDLLFWAGIATMPLLPSVVVPAGTADGLPCGVQLIARRWSDFQLLADAAVICEAADIRFVPPQLPTKPLVG